MSSRLGPVSRCCISPRASHALGVRSHFPALVCRPRVPCSSRTVPSPKYMCFRSVLFRPKAVSLCLLSFVVSGLSLCPSCCYRLRKCLASSLLRLLPSSAVSCRTLPVGLPLPPLVSPFHVASAVCLCSQVCRSFGSSLTLAADLMIGRSPSRQQALLAAVATSTAVFFLQISY